ncbi:tRNA 2-thiouridine(34) synthase MnmA [Enterobacteriaceae endosymbiont of Donacia bicoloricornis]|uniref:tRNA 2-thiouridine(34) synthase MnmA n=1 Tax=Enterobacteriaceae endosymbiont of Donacia bicoloricornis TaxID=2675772 RepID=UPI00144A013B|nr:tRNA 2-thiouridine(34) synthase MnmA [Enterobacteriaceae endosymbiont of Donacia bicoloricornis]QJC37918.1 tRNA 2-thiouridine(34) synthase MnmA [Enterobacteriaceae endosymbiont of Donacia bicoloricornis]
MFKKKVIIAMSGGIDSSFSAWLLKKQNYQVEGLFMKNWEEDDKDNTCNIQKDLYDAEIICKKLKIPLHKINFSSEYWDYVFKKFLSEYKKGYTPNPDILCNKIIKFKYFMNFAINNLGADFISTGHYVRCKKIKNNFFLLRGIDSNKDQSYFLYTIKEKQLKKILFPIGGLKKTEVRYFAKKLKFINANKKDSTGICFIGEKNFPKFLNKYISSPSGDIVNINGKIIGKHKGLIHYTIGQRKGIGLGGSVLYEKKPWYVYKKNIKKNLLTTIQGRKNLYLYSIGLIVKKVNWINYIPKNIKNKYTIKTRYRQKDVKCKIIFLENNRIKVYLYTPISSITKGQSAVFYNGKICLGGGIIEKGIPLIN